MTESHTTFKNLALIVTHKHIDPPGKEKKKKKPKLPEGRLNIYVNNENFLRWLKSCDIKRVISLLGVNTDE